MDDKRRKAALEVGRSLLGKTKQMEFQVTTGDTKVTDSTIQPVQEAQTSIKSETESTNSKIPSNLPYGWFEYKTNEGRPYYHNPYTGVTTWDQPTEEAALADSAIFNPESSDSPTSQDYSNDIRKERYSPPPLNSLNEAQDKIIEPEPVEDIKHQNEYNHRVGVRNDNRERDKIDYSGERHHEYSRVRNDIYKKNDISLEKNVYSKERYEYSRDRGHHRDGTIINGLKHSSISRENTYRRENNTQNKDFDNRFVNRENHHHQHHHHDRREEFPSKKENFYSSVTYPSEGSSYNRHESYSQRLRHDTDQHISKREDSSYRSMENKDRIKSSYEGEDFHQQRHHNHKQYGNRQDNHYAYERSRSDKNIRSEDPSYRSSARSDNRYSESNEFKSRNLRVGNEEIWTPRVRSPIKTELYPRNTESFAGDDRLRQRLPIHYLDSEVPRVERRRDSAPRVNDSRAPTPCDRYVRRSSSPNRLSRSPRRQSTYPIQQSHRINSSPRNDLNRNKSGRSMSPRSINGNRLNTVRSRTPRREIPIDHRNRNLGMESNQALNRIRSPSRDSRDTMRFDSQFYRSSRSPSVRDSNRIPSRNNFTKNSSGFEENFYNGSSSPRREIHPIHSNASTVSTTSKFPDSKQLDKSSSEAFRVNSSPDMKSSLLKHVEDKNLSSHILSTDIDRQNIKSETQSIQRGRYSQEERNETSSHQQLNDENVKRKRSIDIIHNLDEEFIVSEDNEANEAKAINLLSIDEFSLRKINEEAQERARKRSLNTTSRVEKETSFDSSFQSYGSNAITKENNTTIVELNPSRSQKKIVRLNSSSSIAALSPRIDGENNPKIASLSRSLNSSLDSGFRSNEKGRSPSLRGRGGRGGGRGEFISRKPKYEESPSDFVVKSFDEIMKEKHQKN